MKKTIITATLALALGLSGTAAQARSDGSDLLIWNNGDGSDFLEATIVNKWMAWLRIG